MMSLTPPQLLKTALILSAFVVMLALPWFANRGMVFFAAVSYLYIVFAFSWNLMFGYTGMASFGHGAFFAAGAYFYAVIARFFPDIPFLVLLFGCGLFGFLIAATVGLAILRRSHGVYFAVLTIALGQVVYLIVTQTDALGRDDGFTGIVRPKLSIGGATLDLDADDNYYYFVVVFTVVLVGFMWWIVHGRIGRRFRAIQQDADRAAFLGIDVFRTRLLSFALASGIAAMVGGVYAPLLQIVTPALAFFVFSAQPVLYTMLGGMGSFWGPAIGGVVFAVLSYSTRALVGISELTTGLTLLLVVLAFPTGLIGLIGLYRSVRIHRARSGERTATP